MSEKQFQDADSLIIRFFLRFHPPFKSYLENFVYKFLFQIISLLKRNERKKNKENKTKRHFEKNDITIKYLMKRKILKRYSSNKTLR